MKRPGNGRDSAQQVARLSQSGSRVSVSSVIPSSWKSGKEKKSQKLGKGKVNALSLKKIYLALTQELFHHSPSLASRDLAHLADLAKRLGSKAEDLIRFALRNWRLVKAKIGARDVFPSVRTIYAFRDQIMVLTFGQDLGTNDTTRADESEGW